MFALAFFQSNIYRYVCARGCTDEVKTGGETHEIDQLYATGGGTSGQRYVIDPPQGLYYNNSYDDAGVGISVGTNGVSIYEHNYGYMPAVLIWEGTITDWTHIALVYENKIPRLYINGNLVGTGTASPKTHVYPGTLLGSGVFGTMNGWIDEARIWNTVRSQQQIQDNMHKSVATPQSNLEAYWPIQTGETTNLQDISGNNHTVVLPPGNNYGSYTNDGGSTAPLSGDYYYRYGFNGKENDNEVKGSGYQVDYGDRIYDSRLGRWLSVDPLQKKYPNESPYNFVGNNPILYKDADGRDKIITITIIGKDGRKVELTGRDKYYFIYKTNTCTTCPFNETFTKTKYDEHIRMTIDLANPRNSSVSTNLENPKSTSIFNGQWVDRLDKATNSGDQSNITMEGFRIYGSATDGDSWGPKLPRPAKGTLSWDIDALLTHAGNWRSFGPRTYDGDSFSKDLTELMTNEQFKGVVEKAGLVSNALTTFIDASGEKEQLPKPSIRKKIPSGNEGKWVSYFSDDYNTWESERYPDSTVPGKNGAPDTTFEKMDHRPKSPSKRKQ